MLEMVVNGNLFYVCTGITAAVGMISKLTVSIALRNLLRGAANMNKSNHALMRLVKAKFEHACMLNEKVENVWVFVDKYFYEYRVAGIKLHSWRRLELAAASGCFLLGTAGAALTYMVQGMGEAVLRVGAFGAVLAVCVYLVHRMTDEEYRISAARNYMVDYLENVCLHRYEKAHQKEGKETKETQEIQTETPAADIVPAASWLTGSEGEEQKGFADFEDLEGLERFMEARRERELRRTAEKEDIGTPKKTVRAEREKGVCKEPFKEPFKELAKEPAKEPTKEVLIRQILEEFMA